MPKSECSPAPLRCDGRHILRPNIHSIHVLEDAHAQPLDTAQIKKLHNQGSHASSDYPLSIDDGAFFSEALSEMNATAKCYYELAVASIALLTEKMKHGILSFTDLEDAGREIQKLDARFAGRFINKPLDQLHQCMGPDPKHPYSKITLLRTAFTVDVGHTIIPFFFEKFLVSYSYLDESGYRRSTITPIHSHPLNFETIYFASYGQKSCAVEQEYHLTLESGELIVRDDNSLHPVFLADIHSQEGIKVCLIPGPSETYYPTPGPICLKEFSSENVLKAYGEFSTSTDGLFRPHRVTVMDDPDIETRYFALDNYFGPAGRVFIYADDGSVNLWNHEAWE